MLVIWQPIMLCVWLFLKPRQILAVHMVFSHSWWLLYVQTLFQFATRTGNLWLHPWRSRRPWQNKRKPKWKPLRVIPTLQCMNQRSGRPNQTYWINPLFGLWYIVKFYNQCFLFSEGLWIAPALPKYHPSTSDVQKNSVVTSSVWSDTSMIFQAQML